MPKKLDDCVASLMRQGYTEQEAFAICNESINSITRTKQKEDEQVSRVKESPKTRDVPDQALGAEDATTIQNIQRQKEEKED